MTRKTRTTHRRSRSPARPGAGAAPFWRIDLQTERSGFLYYVYRRLTLERNGRRTAVRELTLSLEYDVDLRLVTKPQRLVRQRGRSLTSEERTGIEDRIGALDPWAIDAPFPCSDHLDPAGLDGSVDAEDGRPISLATGEEGPACLSFVREKGGAAKRLVVERFREPPLDCARRTRRAPLASLCAAIDAGLKAEQPFNYRRTRAAADLSDEVERLKSLDYLNLVEFERRSIEALGHLRDADAVPFLTGELFAPDAEVRLQALEALAAIGAESAAREVELLYYAEDLSVREKARRVLERLRPLEGA